MRSTSLINKFQNHELVLLYSSSWLFFCCLFIIFFFIYLITFTLGYDKGLPDFWVMGADSYRVTFTRLFQGHDMALYQSTKHPLFAAVGIPLHRIGNFLFRFLGEPLHENLALVFPVAVIGAINICVAYAIFIKIGFNHTNALLTTLLYGAAGSVWFFSSFPDTYILTALLTNIYIWAILDDPQAKRWLRLVIINTLACYNASQAILLMLIPTYIYLRNFGIKFFWPTFRYGLVILLLYIVPWILFIVDINYPSGELRRMSSIDNLLNPGTWASISSIHLAFGQIFPMIQNQQYGPISIDVLIKAPLMYWLILVAVCTYAIYGWLTISKDDSIEIRTPLLIYCLVYLAFFVAFNPKEAFLYATPAILPIWLLLHSHFVSRQQSKYWRGFIIMLLTISSINNTIAAMDIREYSSPHIKRIGWKAKAAQQEQGISVESVTSTSSNSTTPIVESHDLKK